MRVLLPVLLLAGCAGQARAPDLAAPTPVFDPAAFFAGTSRGQGTLKIIFKKPVDVAVRSNGRIEGQTIVLDQRVREGAKSPRNRTWHLRPVDATHWTGTLTDAKGPVSAEVDGNRLHIRYNMTGGEGVQQWIYLQPGGRVALNRMAVSKFGVHVATLEETITRD